MLPETCRVVIPIKLEFSASVGFIHKESVSIHGHTIIMFMKKSPIYSDTAIAKHRLVALQSDTHFETDIEPINTFNQLKRYHFALC